MIHPYAKYNFAKFFGMADVKQEKTLRINDNIQVQLSLELFKSDNTGLGKTAQQIQFVFQPTCLLSHPLSVSSHTDLSTSLLDGFSYLGHPWNNFFFFFPLYGKMEVAPACSDVTGSTQQLFGEVDPGQTMSPVLGYKDK